ncbi:DnaD domain-containing protein [Clostridium botulinum]|uniref:DnaD domain-containing protein n=1 Tax=Clostridium botulinum TaxID=1491 RepID=UPI001C9B7D36|nr:DnaD domain protein [Clostridium botulinum]MBY6877946.1 DnaD domain protein [Clostridium botulinum]
MAEGKEKGWISLYRAMEDGWLWEDKPFARGQAWIDILLQANHKDKKTFSKGELVTVKRGSFLTSDQLLADRWGWSRKKVRTFLEVLVKEQMIELKRSPKGTSLTLVNWDLYQGLGTTEEQRKIQQRDNRRTTEGTTEEQQKNTNNNVNNDNNDNNVNKYINNKEEINPMEVYQNNIYPMPGVIEIEGIKDWSNTLGDELVVQAIEIAAKKNVRNWKYIERILMDWNSNGIKTLDQAKAYSQNRRKGGQKENDRDRTDNTKDEVKYDFSRFGG